MPRNSTCKESYNDDDNHDAFKSFKPLQQLFLYACFYFLGFPERHPLCYGHGHGHILSLWSPFEPLLLKHWILTACRHSSPTYQTLAQQLLCLTRILTNHKYSIPIAHRATTNPRNCQTLTYQTFVAAHKKLPSFCLANPPCTYSSTCTSTSTTPLSPCRSKHSARFSPFLVQILNLTFCATLFQFQLSLQCSLFPS